MANSLITSSFITNETLRVIHNNSMFLPHINKQYEEKWAKDGAKAGSTISVRRPVQATVRSGATASFQDVNETSVGLTVQPEFGIDWAFQDFDLTLSVDKFSERYLQPFGKRLATELDSRIAQAMYKKVANFVGTPGTSPATQLVALQGQAKLDDGACLRDDERYFALNPLANASMVDGLKATFQSASAIDKQYKSGLMGDALGLHMYMSQNVPTHTVGPLGGTPVVAGANQGTINSGATDNPYASTTSLATSGWTAAAAARLKAGDIITIAGVNAVNPETKADLGYLRQFVVTADVSSDGAGLATVIISPAIIAATVSGSTSAYQNVTARPANLAAITVVTGAANAVHAQNLIWHKDAFTLATVDMDIPGGMDMADRATYDGVSLRFVRGYDITNNKRLCRFDILAAYDVLRPEFACRVTS